MNRRRFLWCGGLVALAMLSGTGASPAGAAAGARIEWRSVPPFTATGQGSAPT